MATTSELAELLGIKSGSLSPFLNRRGGASYKTAQAAAKLLEVSVEGLLGGREPREGERLYGVTYGPRPLDGAEPAPPRDMHALTFVMNLHRMPGLSAWLANHPSTPLPVEALAAAMRAWDALAADKRGNSDGWWTSFLEPYIAAASEPTPPPAPPAPAQPVKSTAGRRRKTGR